ncbi:MAG: methyl-accepting chemotaxis protein [Moorea sp. SIO2B7]|nr:methyl-accepting chemotaxis protein [Moorena sp. SIO2B7]
MEQIASGFSLLPGYLIVLAIVLVILPTIVAVILRYFLHRHLKFLGTKVRRLLGGTRKGNQPKIIENLEQRYLEASRNLEQVNTGALVDGIYSQEKFRFFGLPLRCESVDYFCRILPNLLLAFGLLGTFLGITINLTSLSQTINKVDINDIKTLVGELNTPLQGMGIAFITSLIAVTCSSFLTVINLSWNTTLSKSGLINSLEDYLDNIYLPQLPTNTPMDQAVDRLVTEFSGFLSGFGNRIEQALEKSLAHPIQQIAENNQKTTQLAEQVYSGFLKSSDLIEKGANSFRQAANTIEQSKFAEKLSSATADLSIAQNQFSQSSLVLKKSTQSIEFTLDNLHISGQKMLEIAEEISNLNQKYATIIELNQKRIVVEEAGLNDIKSELANLVEKLRRV